MMNTNAAWVNTVAMRITDDGGDAFKLATIIFFVNYMCLVVCRCKVTKSFAILFRFSDKKLRKRLCTRRSVSPLHISVLPA